MQRYEAYKDSGVEWIGEIPAGWDSRNLGACSLLIQTGPFGSQLHQSDYGKGGDVAVINPTDIVDGAIEIDRAHLISAEKAKELGKHLLSLGNLVIGRRGEMGRCALVESDEQALCGTGCLKVVLDGTVLPKYIAAQLISQSVKEYLELNAVGTTLKNLNTNIVASIPIVIPPLPEQQFIADYLDAKTAKIDSIVSQTERSIELLREYRKSVISEAVTKGLDPDTPMKDSGIEWIGEIPEGWELLRMKRIGSFAKGTGIKKDEVLPEGMPCVRYGELYTTYEHCIADPASFVSDDLFSRSTRLHNGEVVFALTGENEEDIGRCVVNLSGEALAVGGDTLAFTGHRQDGRFIAYSCNSKYFNVQRTLFARGGIIVHLPAGAVINATIVLPPLPEQQAIANYLDEKTAEIDSLIADKQRQVELLREYRKSLISEAVTGKFKVPGLE